MSHTEFSKGFLSYKSGMKNASDIDIDFPQWKDGYIAFSNTEKRLKHTDISEITYADPVPGIGYVMEIDLWKKDKDVWEEIALEREDKGFFYQHWKLFGNGKTDDPDLEKADCCFWRMADTLVRKPVRKDSSIFGDTKKNDLVLKTIEVICPQHRLHFFITAGEEVAS
ncbi:MAG: hypothetical protein V2I97_17720 [Desulfococcaceae bacterium]|nr:hypothetical protein [Desulfococcaceae bacterium]